MDFIPTSRERVHCAPSFFINFVLHSFRKRYYFTDFITFLPNIFEYKYKEKARNHRKIPQLRTFWLSRGSKKDAYSFFTTRLEPTKN